MFVSDQLKTIFIHAHRTGGTSIENLLRPYTDAHRLPLNQHENVRSLGAEYFEPYADYFTFMFVRNPWERLYSWFLINANQVVDNEITEQNQFKLWINDIILHPAAYDVGTWFHFNQLDFVTDRNGKCWADWFGRFEHFDRDVGYLCEKLKLAAVEVPHVNQLASHDYVSAYTPETRELVGRLCAKDIATFKYKFGAAN